MPPSPPAKRYRGHSIEERRAQRRRRLIEAAVSVYGARGYRNATVKAICAAAGLTERYFYESFDSQEDLLLAALQGGQALLRQVILAAAEGQPPGGQKERAMLAAYYGALQAEPVAARLFLTEMVGVSPAADAAAKTWRGGFADLLEAAFGRPVGAAEPLLKAGVIGAINNIAVTWVASGYAEPLAEVVGAALRVCALLEGG